MRLQQFASIAVPAGGVRYVFRLAAAWLEFLPVSFRKPFASKARLLSRPPRPTGGPSPSPTGTGPTAPAPARAGERPGDSLRRSPSMTCPRRGRSASARSGRPDTLTTA